MRISTKELKILNGMEDTAIGGKMGLVKFIRRLSADLLEARDRIKEMREEINITLRDFEKIDEVCRIANAMPFSLTKKKLAELLERTKEYI